MKTEDRRLKANGRLRQNFLKKNFYLLSVVYCLLSINVCCAQEIISAEELIANAKEYDGKTVIYEGELIGEPLRRKEGRWFNLYDGKSALGVWVSDEDLIKVYFTGGYKAVGDRLSVTGIFHRSCSLHGGDLDIHAHKIIMKEIGRIRPHSISPYKEDLLKYLSGALLCLLVILLILKKRQRSI